jgi:antirestriction protein
MDEFNVWVGCLACYNAGNLRGEWRPAGEAGEWRCPITHHEEFHCFDVEAPHASLRHEMSPMEADRIAEVLQEVEDSCAQPLAWLAWCANVGESPTSWEDNEDSFLSQYNGEWDSEREFSDDIAEQTLLASLDESVRDTVEGYFDWDKYHHEMFVVGPFWSEDAPGGGYFIFNGDA